MKHPSYVGSEPQPPVPGGSLKQYHRGKATERRTSSCPVLGTPSQVAGLQGAAEYANQKGKGDLR